MLIPNHSTQSQRKKHSAKSSDRMQIHGGPGSCPTCNDAHHTLPRQAAQYN